MSYIQYGTRQLTDYLSVKNDDKEFSKSFKCMYPGVLELKHSGIHATFLELDIKIENGIFVYKFFDKKDKFTFSIVCMRHF